MSAQALPTTTRGRIMPRDTFRQRAVATVAELLPDIKPGYARELFVMASGAIYTRAKSTIVPPSAVSAGCWRRDANPDDVVDSLIEAHAEACGNA